MTPEPYKGHFKNQSSAAVIVAVLALTATASAGTPTPPKVPFGNTPCQSLSAEELKQIEQKGLGYARPSSGKPDRAPATLPFENVCSYEGYIQVGYMTQIDFQTNRDGNRSTSHPAPNDLPQAFYDKQGGLWFEKNGYYVVVSGKSALREPAARIIVGKL